MSWAVKPARLRTARMQAGFADRGGSRETGHPATGHLGDGASKAEGDAEELAKLARLYRVSETLLRAKRSTRATDNGRRSRLMFSHT